MKYQAEQVASRSTIPLHAKALWRWATAMRTLLRTEYSHDHKSKTTAFNEHTPKPDIGCCGLHYD